MRLTRRSLLQGAGGTLCVALGACRRGGDADTTNDWPAVGVVGNDDVVLGLYPSSRMPSAEDAVRHALAHVDMSWLAKGDRVLVKIASNSHFPHPATTSPAAVRALVAELKARGAGRVVVGEQSGVEYVRLVAGEKRFSSTKAQLAQNGLLEAIGAAGAEAYLFDDHGYDAGYFAATPPAGSHWTQPMMLPTVVRDVDHIVYLPRLSSHVIAGYTHGLKIAVGWLRDDSRNHLHLDAASFYEKYCEINYAAEIQARLRLCVTLAESVLLHFGPDHGTVYAADPRLVVASRNLASHELVTSGIVTYLSGVVAPEPGLHYQTSAADSFNQLFVTQVVAAATGLPWGPGDPASYTHLKAHEFEKGVSSDRAIARALAIAGGGPKHVAATVVAEAPDAGLAAAIASHAEGRVSLA